MNTWLGESLCERVELLGVWPLEPWLENGYNAFWQSINCSCLFIFQTFDRDELQLNGGNGKGELIVFSGKLFHRLSHFLPCITTIFWNDARSCFWKNWWPGIRPWVIISFTFSMSLDGGDLYVQFVYFFSEILVSRNLNDPEVET